jgi:pimeloyl-ACP methyl ester carboxylesterase
MMAYRETFVQRDQHRIYVRDHPGAEPAIILMHGFPDNVHLYDRLSPYLSPPRRIVLFDFLGWGSSDKPSGYPYTTDNQVGDLDAVITNWGSGKSSSSRTTPQAHRPSTGRWPTPSASPRWCC